MRSKSQPKRCCKTSNSIPADGVSVATPSGSFAADDDSKSFASSDVQQEDGAMNLASKTTISNGTTEVTEIPQVLYSQRWQPLRVFENCRFRMIRSNARGHAEWRCNEQNYPNECSCRLKTEALYPFNTLPGQEGQVHNHPKPDVLELLAHQARNRMREQARAAVFEPTNKILKSATEGVAPEMQLYLPNKEALRRQIQRQKASSSATLLGGKVTKKVQSKT